MLHCDKKNHASAIQFPKDIDAYMQEEKQHSAVIGLFIENLIADSHISPFMTQEKLNAPN